MTAWLAHAGVGPPCVAELRLAPIPLTVGTRIFGPLRLGP